jgi:hypothetical protein
VSCFLPWPNQTLVAVASVETIICGHCYSIPQLRSRNTPQSPTNRLVSDTKKDMTWFFTNSVSRPSAFFKFCLYECVVTATVVGGLPPKGPLPPTTDPIERLAPVTTSHDVSRMMNLMEQRMIKMESRIDRLEAENMELRARAVRNLGRSG